MARKKTDQEMVEKLTNKSDDLSKWYTGVVQMAELADYAPVKGCMVIRPYGYAIWEAIRDRLDRRLKETGHKNAYFPLLIPESFLDKEAEHVEGFAPEVAWVTHGGKHELEERLAIRPTSEAIICHMYARWISSWRDLPVLINQWANVLRWEMATRPFLRTTEFLWQEGHTVHETHEEARREAMMILELYKELIEDDLAMPVLTGSKSESERFAGADETYTLEVLMPDGKALQAGTTHDLGQHFARAFGISFLDREGGRRLPWQTSWGVSTRLVGGLIMSHGDDRGLILPPKVAPTQVVIVPIWQSQTHDRVRKVVEFVRDGLEGIRVEADLREEHTPGWKFNEHEMRGVPIRLEIGPRDIEKDQVMLVSRDTGAKRPEKIGSVRSAVERELERIQEDLLVKARALVEDKTVRPKNLEDFEAAAADGGFMVAGWCGNVGCEAHVKERTTATIRAIPFEPEAASCIYCGKAGKKVHFARSY